MIGRKSILKWFLAVSLITFSGLFSLYEIIGVMLGTKLQMRYFGLDSFLDILFVASVLVASCMFAIWAAGFPGILSTWKRWFLVSLIWINLITIAYIGFDLFHSISHIQSGWTSPPVYFCIIYSILWALALLILSDANGKEPSETKTDMSTAM